jgi:hypothetical protein
MPLLQQVMPCHRRRRLVRQVRPCHSEQRPVRQATPCHSKQRLVRQATPCHSKQRLVRQATPRQKPEGSAKAEAKGLFRKEPATGLEPSNPRFTRAVLYQLSYAGLHVDRTSLAAGCRTTPTMAGPGVPPSRPVHTICTQRIKHTIAAPAHPPRRLPGAACEASSPRAGNRLTSRTFALAPVDGAIPSRRAKASIPLFA